MAETIPIPKGDFDDLLARLRALANDPVVRQALHEEGVHVDHEDDNALTLELVGDGILKREFARSLGEIDRTFVAQASERKGGKLKAKIVCTVEFEFNLDTDMTTVTAGAALTLPRGQKVGRAADYFSNSEAPFRCERVVPGRQGTLIPLSLKRA